MAKMQKDSTPSPTSDMLAGTRVDDVFNNALEDEKKIEYHPAIRQQMSVYKALITVFAEESEQIRFAPANSIKMKEALVTKKLKDGYQYYEVPLYIKSLKPICSTSPGEDASPGKDGKYENSLIINMRYSDAKVLEAFFHVADERTANATLTEDSIEDLAYVRDHMADFPPKGSMWSSSGDVPQRAQFFYRMFRLIFRSTVEIRKLMSTPLSEGLLTASLARSLAQSVFVDSFVCVTSGFDEHVFANMLPASSPSTGLSTTELEKDLKIKIFDFNEETESKEAKLKSSYDALFRSLDGTEDILVTCQTEATTSAHTMLLKDHRWVPKFPGRSGWTLMGHGKHSGMTGITDYNAQILNVFVKTPETSDVEIERWPLDWETKKDWVNIRGWAKRTRRGTYLANTGGGADTLIEAASFTLADGTFTLSAKSRLHETSPDGKGGISTLLSYQSAPGKPRTRISVVCGHLDSETQAGREAGAAELLEEAVDNAARTLIVKPWKQIVSRTSAGKPEVDAVFLTGDLNYRLWYDARQPLSDNGAMANLLYTEAGRQKLGEYDQLRAPDASSDSSRFSILTRTSDFGMQCNQPFASYLPTYKRRNKEACVELGTNAKMHECGSVDRDDCRKKCKTSDNFTRHQCDECFAVEKTCESLALHCATGSPSSKDDQELKFDVESGNDLGIKTKVLKDPVTGDVQLWITDVIEGKYAANVGITPGEWTVTAVKTTDVNHYNKYAKTNPSNAEKWRSSVYVKKLKKAVDVEQQVVAILNGLATRQDGWKVRVTFVKPQAKWSMKEDQFLQLGWLDRVCWKTAPSSSATVSLIDDKGLMDSQVSDHMPVHWTAILKRASVEAS